MHLFLINRNKMKNNWCKRKLYIAETIESGFKTGSELSSKITEKNNESKTPTVTETKYNAHDKFWCMPLLKNETQKI